MFIADTLIGDSLRWCAWLACAVVLAGCLRYADWRALRGVPLRQHLLYGCLFFMVILWMISVRTFEGLWLHFLGVTTVCLLLGWRFTMLAGALACTAQALLIGEPLAAAPLAWCLSVLVPASVTRLLVYWLRRQPQRNLFVYLLGAGFGGGVLAAASLCAAGILALAWSGQRDWAFAALESWPLLALIAFPEGFINGTVLSVMVVLNPEAVKTFDSDKYLGD